MLYVIFVFFKQCLEAGIVANGVVTRVEAHHGCAGPGGAWKKGSQLGDGFLCEPGLGKDHGSVNYVMNWWDEVNSINDGAAADFVRLFAVPGMNHCGGGPATDRYDALSAVVNWVENGIAPDRIIGTAGDQTAWPGRTRPLCPWPQQARYKGSGSIEEADNFDCVGVMRN
mgnify:CR=1 FL=1